MAEIRRHPEIGIGILSPLLDDRTALDVVLYHHEAELESEAGRQFDPKITRHVAAAFLGEVAAATIQS